MEKRKITDKEKKILELVAEGNSDSEISELMKVTIGMVRFHLNKLLLKTSCINRTALVTWGFRNKILK